MACLTNPAIMQNSQTPSDINGSNGSISFGGESKMFYKITQQNSAQTLEEINNLTNNLDTSNGIEPQFVTDLQEKLNDDPEKIVFSGFLYAPKNIEVRKKVIGKNGWSFYMTTQNADILFIWDDRNSNRFRFWSFERKNLINAQNLIKWRINKISNENQGWK